MYDSLLVLFQAVQYQSQIVHNQLERPDLVKVLTVAQEVLLTDLQDFDNLFGLCLCILGLQPSLMPLQMPLP